MDCDMPVMDGWEATSVIRAAEEERGWGRVPIIAVTAYASSDSQARSIDSGMDDYLTKPYSLASLRQKIALHMVRSTESPAVGASGAASAEQQLLAAGAASATPAGGGAGGRSHGSGSMPPSRHKPSPLVPKRPDPTPPQVGASPDEGSGSGNGSPKASAAAGPPAAAEAAAGGSAPAEKNEGSASALAEPPAKASLSPELAAAVEAVYAGVAEKSVVNAQQMKAIFGGKAVLTPLPPLPPPLMRGRRRRRCACSRPRSAPRPFATARPSDKRSLPAPLHWPRAVCTARRLRPGNTQLMSQAVSMFIASSKDVPETIEAALAQHDFERLHRAVHQCKGSAGYIGAERVHAISLELQTSARSLQQQQAAAAEEAGTAALEAPLEVRAQVHALTRCMAELFTQLEGMQPQ